MIIVFIINLDDILWKQIVNQDFKNILNKLYQQRKSISDSLFAILKFTTRTLKSTTDVSNSLWNPFISRITPNIFRFLIALNSILDSNLWTQFRPDFQSLTTSITMNRQDNGESFLYSLRSWINTSRENCLIIIGTISNSRLFYEKNVNEIIQALFSFSDFFTTRILNQIVLHSVIKITKNCPRERFSEILVGLLSFTFKYLSTRLNKEWVDLVNRGIQLDCQEDEHGNLIDEMTREQGDVMEEVDEEIAAEQMLRTLTRSVSSKFLAALFRVEKNDGGEDKFVYECCEYILTQREVVEPLMELLMELMVMKDTVSARAGADTMYCIMKLVLVGDTNEWDKKIELICFRVNQLVEAQGEGVELLVFLFLRMIKVDKEKAEQVIGAQLVNEISGLEVKEAARVFRGKKKESVAEFKRVKVVGANLLDHEELNVELFDR